MVLIARVGQREVITSACPVALELGLRHGMAAAHARALVTDLDVRDAEPEQDRALLGRLALHAVGRWTPTASVAGSDGLWLDLTGTTHLFGGEARFCRRLLHFLRRLGFTAAVAIAGTLGAAHGIERDAPEARGSERIVAMGYLHDGRREPLSQPKPVTGTSRPSLTLGALRGAPAEGVTARPQGVR